MKMKSSSGDFIPTSQYGLKIALYVLEKLFEVWDLTPGRRKSAGYGLRVEHDNEWNGNLVNASRVLSWYDQGGISPTELTNTLQRFIKDGLVVDFEFVELGEYQELSCLRINFSPDFGSLYESYRARLSVEYSTERNVEIYSKNTARDEIPSMFKVTIKDREIWVNEFMLSRPFAAGKNKGFFDYIFGLPEQLIRREEMPEYVKKEVGNKRFTKILNYLGFTGEILKAFFRERGQNKLIFKKEIKTDQLETDGIKVALLLQQLKTAHLRKVRSSPKLS